MAGCGAASYLAEERDAANIYVWSKRGAETGELIRRYCTAGAPRERLWFQEAMERHAYPAKIQIGCP
jgi:hypothetical protein